MRNFVRLLLAVVFTFTLSLSREAHAEMGAKPKAFLTIAGYGAAGGALLGAASMAFGADVGAIAKGASLGLYAGIIFGTYVLVSHHQKRYGSYDDNSSPYQDSNDIYGDDYQGDEGGSGEGEDSRGGFFDRFQTYQTKLSGMAGQKKGGTLIPPISLNIIQYNF